MSVDVKGDQSGQAVTRPMNGDEYIESLQDGRQIYIHGERVEDVTTHPAFRNSVQVDRAAVQRAARPGAPRTS